MIQTKNRNCIDTFSEQGVAPRLPTRRSFANLPAKVVDILLKWQERAFERRALREMDARQLKDIGLSRADADAEARKPFWRG